ncbi:MAG TPA: hypothetical protein PLE60_14905, partial [Candidatus Latescibacteria bacterium]|nr:hypothetical protein [Candidatus Latescibacterota bacterium]
MRRLSALFATVLLLGAGSAGAVVTISNTGTPAAGELLTNTADQAITRIRLVADASEGATITQVTLTKAGTAINGTDWDQLDLYWDNGNGTFSVGEETKLGSTVTPSGTTTAFVFNTTNFPQDILTGETKYLWAVVRTTANPVPGRTLRLSIAAATDIAVSAGTMTGTATGNYKTVWGPIVSRGAFSAALGELPPS